jgi:DNA-binding MarR family transcriptional regulator
VTRRRIEVDDLVDLADAGDRELREAHDAVDANHPRLVGTRQTGLFGAWVFTERCKAKLTLAVLSERANVSASWLSKVESGGSLPGPAQAQRITLALGGNPFAVLQLLETDRKRRTAACRAAGSKGLPLGGEERKAHGRSQRLRLLRTLVTITLQQGHASSIARLAKALDLHVATVGRHIEILEAEGYVCRREAPGEISLVLLTRDGIDRALADHWAAPFDEASPALVYLMRKTIAHQAGRRVSA